MHNVRGFGIGTTVVTVWLFKVLKVYTFKVLRQIKVDYIQICMWQNYKMPNKIIDIYPNTRRHNP